ncbi:MAG: hypothetical protein QM569_04640 [Acidovorax sp.]|uniref:hypothetical protein n=1 Tax=Acidovorax sp. TaxID=1872122 RepID=UPI0039E4A3FD
MPIYRCKKCGFVCEDAQTPINTQAACGRCGTPSTVYGTVYFVEELVKRLTIATRELQTLKAAAEAAAPHPAPASPGALTSAEQHAPLLQWFAARKIEAQFDYANVDTSGFFDDAAQRLGDNYALFGELIDRVRFAYRKSHSWVNLELGKLPQKDAQAINQLCRQLYEHTFFARYHYQKPEKIVRLTLQTAPAVRQFFDGGWLEWYALMCLLEHARERAAGFSCARGVKVVFPNEDLHELDVVCLPTGQPPICIECKSGEFRRDIDKYLRLRKRLDVDRSRFLICSADLTQEQAAGLSAMYELSFVNLQTLKDHLQRLM